MSTPFTPANVDSLKHNPAWEHIVQCLESELQTAEVMLELEGEFNHGKGIGLRTICKLVLHLPDQMAEQAGGKSFVQRIKGIGR